MSAAGPAIARLRFRAETGSLYELSRDALGMRWRRASATMASGVLPSEGGRLLAWPVVEVGWCCALWSEPLVPPWPRLVLTSEVFELEARTPGGRRWRRRGSAVRRASGSRTHRPMTDGR